MLDHQQKNGCRTKTAIFFIIILGFLFLLIGCRSIYEKLGMTPDQVDRQVDADNIFTSQILDQARSSIGQLVTQILAGVGAIGSGILATYLGRERKITKVLITSIEKAGDSTVKNIIHTKATDAGVQTKLAKRVSALT